MTSCHILLVIHCHVVNRKILKLANVITASILVKATAEWLERNIKEYNGGGKCNSSSDAEAEIYGTSIHGLTIDAVLSCNKENESPAWN